MRREKEEDNKARGMRFVIYLSSNINHYDHKSFYINECKLIYLLYCKVNVLDTHVDDYRCYESMIFSFFITSFLLRYAILCVLF